MRPMSRISSVLISVVGSVMAPGCGSDQPTAFESPKSGPDWAQTSRKPLPPAGLSFVTGFYHTCGLDQNAHAYCWGFNRDGEIGTTDNVSTDPSVNPTPVPVQGNLSFVALSGGQYFTCGLGSNGQLYCWGNNDYGQLGSAATTPTTSPAPVTSGPAFSRLTTGARHTCALDDTGHAYCWGYNYHGELGTTTNNLNENANPTAMAVSGGLTFVALAAGAFHTCGITGGGAAYCWGWNNFGQVGPTNSGTDNPNPVPQLVPLQQGTKLVALAAGQYHTCGLTGSNSVFCWGYNGNGQLGNSANAFTQMANPTPLLVQGLSQASAIVAGAYHTCELQKSVAYCWGYNGTGQLGTSQFLGTSTATPVQVSGGIAFATLAAGESHTCGVTSAGVVYCWGNNNSGELGTTTNAGTLTPIPTPTQVAGLTFRVP